MAAPADPGTTGATRAPWRLERFTRSDWKLGDYQCHVSVGERTRRDHRLEREPAPRRPWLRFWTGRTGSGRGWRRAELRCGPRRVRLPDVRRTIRASAARSDDLLDLPGDVLHGHLCVPR